jgi:hypothetical protein
MGKTKTGDELVTMSYFCGLEVSAPKGVFLHFSARADDRGFEGQGEDLFWVLAYWLRKDRSKLTYLGLANQYNRDTYRANFGGDDRYIVVDRPLNLPITIMPKGTARIRSLSGKFLVDELGKERNRPKRRFKYHRKKQRVR